MIKEKDVIILLLPYPDDKSELAKSKHMYICISVNGEYAEFVKCQSYKIYHCKPGAPPQNRILETPNDTRNCFRKPTIIDLDKTFIIPIAMLKNVNFGSRKVCEDLFNDIKNVLAKSNPVKIYFTEEEIENLNA